MEALGVGSERAFEVEFSGAAWARVGRLSRPTFVRLRWMLEAVAARAARDVADGPGPLNARPPDLTAGPEDLHVDGHRVLYRVEPERRTVVLVDVVLVEADLWGGGLRGAAH
jgi:hypothetical protein